MLTELCIECIRNRHNIPKSSIESRILYGYLKSYFYNFTYVLYEPGNEYWRKRCPPKNFIGSYKLESVSLVDCLEKCSKIEACTTVLFYPTIKDKYICKTVKKVYDCDQNHIKHSYVLPKMYIYVRQPNICSNKSTNSYFYYLINGLCITFLFNQSFSMANEYCSSMNMDLLRIESTSNYSINKQNLIKYIFKQYETYVWLGIGLRNGSLTWISSLKEQNIVSIQQPLLIKRDGESNDFCFAGVFNKNGEMNRIHQLSCKEKLMAICYRNIIGEWSDWVEINSRMVRKCNNPKPLEIFQGNRIFCNTNNYIEYSNHLSRTVVENKNFSFLKTNLNEWKEICSFPDSKLTTGPSYLLPKESCQNECINNELCNGIVMRYGICTFITSFCYPLNLLRKGSENIEIYLKFSNHCDKRPINNHRNVFFMFHKPSGYCFALFYRKLNRLQAFIECQKLNMTMLRLNKLEINKNISFFLNHVIDRTEIWIEASKHIKGFITPTKSKTNYSALNPPCSTIFLMGNKEIVHQTVNCSRHLRTICLSYTNCEWYPWQQYTNCALTNHNECRSGFAIRIRKRRKEEFYQSDCKGPSFQLKSIEDNRLDPQILLMSIIITIAVVSLTIFTIYITTKIRMKTLLRDVEVEKTSISFKLHSSRSSTSQTMQEDALSNVLSPSQ